MINVAFVMLFQEWEPYQCIANKSLMHHILLVDIWILAMFCRVELKNSHFPPNGIDQPTCAT